VQCRDDRLALGADNVCRVVMILIVRFHHVEDHRLRLITGRAPNPRKSGESLSYLVPRCDICHNGCETENKNRDLFIPLVFLQLCLGFSAGPRAYGTQRGVESTLLPPRLGTQISALGP
jgi:hypothetical protein